jgi:HTH-type transcriptional regulator, sugar sensing transcriptional regulator
MNIEESLRQLDLTDNEIKVYLTLIKFGNSKAGRIAKESMIERSSTYNAIKRLLEKGMISYAVEANCKIYSATNPNKIIDYFKEKEEVAQKIIPSLEAIYKDSGAKEDIKLFRGYKGIKSILQEIIRDGNENCVYGSEGIFSERMPYYAPMYMKLIEDKKIKIKNLRSTKSKSTVSKTTEVRYVPKKFESNVETNIFGDKIAIIIWSETPEAVLIKNKIAAESYKAYFDFMWSKAKKTI